MGAGLQMFMMDPSCVRDPVWRALQAAGTVSTAAHNDHGSACTRRSPVEPFRAGWVSCRIVPQARIQYAAMVKMILAVDPNTPDSPGMCRVASASLVRARGIETFGDRGESWASVARRRGHFGRDGGAVDNCDITRDF